MTCKQLADILKWKKQICVKGGGAMGALGELTVPQLEALLKKLRGEYRE